MPSQCFEFCLFLIKSRYTADIHRPGGASPILRPGPAGGSVRAHPGPRQGPACARPQWRRQGPPSRCPAERDSSRPSAPRSPAAARQSPAAPAPPSLTACSTPPSCPGRCRRRRQVEPPAVPRPQIPRGSDAPQPFPRPPRRLPPHRAAVPLRKGSGERAERDGSGRRGFLAVHWRVAKVPTEEGLLRVARDALRGAEPGRKEPKGAERSRAEPKIAERSRGPAWARGRARPEAGYLPAAAGCPGQGGEKPPCPRQPSPTWSRRLLATEERKKEEF